MKSDRWCVGHSRGRTSVEKHITYCNKKTNGKINVLVVEDEADIQQLVSYNLIRAGFHVTCADSGEEALERLRTEQIDCVLLI